MPCYIVVHAYYDAVVHSCRLVVLQLYAMVDRDSFQTAKTHFTELWRSKKFASLFSCNISETICSAPLNFICFHLFWNGKPRQFRFCLKKLGCSSCVVVMDLWQDRSVDILTERVRRINVTETQDWRFGLVGVGCLITVEEVLLSVIIMGTWTQSPDEY